LHGGFLKMKSNLPKIPKMKEGKNKIERFVGGKDKFIYFCNPF